MQNPQHLKIAFCSLHTDELTWLKLCKNYCYAQPLAFWKQTTNCNLETAAVVYVNVFPVVGFALRHRFSTLLNYAAFQIRTMTEKHIKNGKDRNKNLKKGWDFTRFQCFTKVHDKAKPMHCCHTAHSPAPGALDVTVETWRSQVVLMFKWKEC